MDEKMMKNEDIEVDLGRIFRAVIKRGWVVLLISVLCAALAFCTTFLFITPKYTSSAMFYVNNNSFSLADASVSISSGDLVTSRNLVDSYIVILNTRETLVDVIDYAGVSRTFQEVKGMISSEAVNETEIFEVRVTGANYKHVAQIANAIADVLPEKITAVVEGSSVRVVDRAVENPNPVGPNYRSYMMLGAAAGFGLCLVALLVLELLDTTIYSEEYLSQTYEKYPLLTVIPGAEANTKYAYKGYYEMPHNRRTFPKTGGSQK